MNFLICFSFAWLANYLIGRFCDKFSYFDEQANQNDDEEIYDQFDNEGIRSICDSFATTAVTQNNNKINSSIDNNIEKQRNRKLILATTAFLAVYNNPRVVQATIVFLFKENPDIIQKMYLLPIMSMIFELIWSIFLGKVAIPFYRKNIKIKKFNSRKINYSIRSNIEESMVYRVDV
mgnify:CR=1 FL=1